MKVYLIYSYEVPFIPASLATTKTQTRTVTSIGKGVEKLEHSYVASGNVKWCSHSGKVWQFLKILNIKLSYDTAVLLLDVYPREMKHVHKKLVYGYS